MGIGDNIMATGMARGAAARGVRIAFGDNGKLKWDGNSSMVFENNPNIAFPGTEHRSDVEWIAYYKGKRGYNRQEDDKRWVWNYEFKVQPGEFFFSEVERFNGRREGEGFIVIEPAQSAKAGAFNKNWPRERYQAVVDALRETVDIIQFSYDPNVKTLFGIRGVKTRSFRDAAAIMSHASLYIGPEGGLHHTAAAVGIPAVVLFGGFIPPAVTGYEGHTNLTGGAKKACGSLNRCAHCVQAMDAITVSEVVSAAKNYLQKRAA